MKPISIGISEVIARAYSVKSPHREQDAKETAPPTGGEQKSRLAADEPDGEPQLGQFLDIRV